MALRITVNLTGLDRATRRMVKASGNLRKPFGASRRDTRKDERDHMRAQLAPSSRKFAPLAPSTREKRLRTGGRKNKFTKRGRMKKKAERSLNRVLSRKMITGKNLKIKVTKKALILMAKQGAAHLTGARVGKGSKLPKREWLYFSLPLQEKIAKRIAEHLKANFKG